MAANRFDFGQMTDTYEAAQPGMRLCYDAIDRFEASQENLHSLADWNDSADQRLEELAHHLASRDMVYCCMLDIEVLQQSNQPLPASARHIIRDELIEKLTSLMSAKRLTTERVLSVIESDNFQLSNALLSNCDSSHYKKRPDYTHFTRDAIFNYVSFLSYLLLKTTNNDSIRKIFDVFLSIEKQFILKETFDIITRKELSLFIKDIFFTGLTKGVERNSLSLSQLIPTLQTFSEQLNLQPTLVGNPNPDLFYKFFLLEIYNYILNYIPLFLKREHINYRHSLLQIYIQLEERFHQEYLVEHIDQAPEHLTYRFQILDKLSQFVEDERLNIEDSLSIINLYFYKIRMAQANYPPTTLTSQFQIIQFSRIINALQTLSALLTKTKDEKIIEKVLTTILYLQEDLFKRMLRQAANKPQDLEPLIDILSNSTLNANLMSNCVFVSEIENKQYKQKAHTAIFTYVQFLKNISVLIKSNKKPAALDKVFNILMRTHYFWHLSLFDILKMNNTEVKSFLDFLSLMSPFSTRFVLGFLQSQERFYVTKEVRSSFHEQNPDAFRYTFSFSPLYLFCLDPAKPELVSSILSLLKKLVTSSPNDEMLLALIKNPQSQHSLFHCIDHRAFGIDITFAILQKDFFTTEEIKKFNPRLKDDLEAYLIKIPDKRQRMQLIASSISPSSGVGKVIWCGRGFTRHFKDPNINSGTLRRLNDHYLHLQIELGITQPSIAQSSSYSCSFNQSPNALRS